MKFPGRKRSPPDVTGVSHVTITSCRAVGAVLSGCTDTNPVAAFGQPSNSKAAGAPERAHRRLGFERVS
jgi:hypothetical protein